MCSDCWKLSITFTAHLLMIHENYFWLISTNCAPSKKDHIILMAKLSKKVITWQLPQIASLSPSLPFKHYALIMFNFFSPFPHEFFLNLGKEKSIKRLINKNLCHDHDLITDYIDYTRRLVHCLLWDIEFFYFFITHFDHKHCRALVIRQACQFCLINLRQLVAAVW